MKKLIILLVFTTFAGCGKNIDTDDVIEDLSVTSTTVDANGSTIGVSATINSRASSDKRNVIFTATGGDLTGNTNGKLTVPAVLQNGKLIATATWKAPMKEGDVTITAAAEALSPNGDYSKSVVVSAKAVAASSIHLETSSYGIAANFMNTDTLVASLKNQNNGRVSTTNVVFEDIFHSGASAGGRFRGLQTASDGNSQVKALYSARDLPIGQDILIEVSILDAAGNKTNKRDTVILTINQ